MQGEGERVGVRRGGRNAAEASKQKGNDDGGSVLLACLPEGEGSAAPADVFFPSVSEIHVRIF